MLRMCSKIRNNRREVLLVFKVLLIASCCHGSRSSCGDVRVAQERRGRVWCAGQAELLCAERPAVSARGQGPARPPANLQVRPQLWRSCTLPLFRTLSAEHCMLTLRSICDGQFMSGELPEKTTTSKGGSTMRESFVSFCAINVASVKCVRYAFLAGKRFTGQTSRDRHCSPRL